jgi:hypothetical protein
VKHLIWVPLALALLALVAAGVVRSATGDAHAHEVAAAAAVCIVSATLALVPITLARRSDAVVVFQAAFGGTVIHMFLAIALAAACHVLQLVADRRLFLFLLLSFYFVSLIVMVLAMVRIFRKSTLRGTPARASHAPPPTQPPPPGSPTPQAT